MTSRPRAKRSSVPSIPIARFQLACGARLLVSPRPGAPVCAVQMHLRGGHSLDPRGREGTAFLTGKDVDQGTAGYTEEELAAALENVGGNIGGGSTGVSGTIVNDRWRLLLDLLAECVVAPVYPEGKFERQKRRLLDRLVIERDDPRARGGWLFRRLVYGRHWLGRPDYGTLESVERIKRADVRAFHAQNWCGKRAVISFCGDADPQDVKRHFERRLAGWRAGTELPPPDMRFPPLRARTGVFRAARQQVHLYLGHLGIKRTDPDYPALVVMDHILGTGPGFTSRISQRLRDEEGLAYTVDAAIHSSAGVLPGTFTAYIGTSPENVTRALRGFREEILRIQREPVREDELELVRSYLTGSYALGFERASRRASYMVSGERNGLPDDFLARLVASFESIGPEDVRRVARAHLWPDAACVVASGPLTRAELARALAPTRGRAARAG